MELLKLPLWTHSAVFRLRSEIFASHRIIARIICRNPGHDKVKITQKKLPGVYMYRVYTRGPYSFFLRVVSWPRKPDSILARLQSGLQNCAELHKRMVKTLCAT